MQHQAEKPDPAEKQDETEMLNENLDMAEKPNSKMTRKTKRNYSKEEWKNEMVSRQARQGNKKQKVTIDLLSENSSDDDDDDDEKDDDTIMEKGDEDEYERNENTEMKEKEGDEDDYEKDEDAEMKDKEKEKDDTKEEDSNETPAEKAKKINSNDTPPPVKAQSVEKTNCGGTDVNINDKNSNVFTPLKPKQIGSEANFHTGSGIPISVSNSETMSATTSMTASTPSCTNSTKQVNVYNQKKEALTILVRKNGKRS